MALQSKTAQLGDVELNYVEADGSGPPLVLVHGITGSLSTYVALIPELAQDAHVYAIDLRGHGRSSHTPGAYHVADYGRDLAAFLEEVVGGPAVVAGHSLGALVASWTGAHAGTNIRGILLEDPPMYSAQMPRIKGGGAYRYFVEFRRMLDAHAAAGGTLEDLVVQIGQRPANNGQTLLEGLGPEWVRAYAEEMHRFDPRVLDEPIDGRLYDGFDPDADLPRISCPVHLLAGKPELGGELTADDVQRVVSAIPHCTYTVVEVGHGIHDGAPDVYLRDLRQLLQSAA